MIDSPLIDRDYVGGETYLAPMLAERYTHARSGQRALIERAWRVNQAWFAGRPYYRVNNKGELEWLKPQNRKDFVHIDVIHPRVLTLVGHMGYRPRFEAKHGAAADLGDFFRARAAADVANHASEASGFARAVREIQLLVHVFGHCWAKVGWDTESGPVGPVYGQVPCPQCQGNGAITGADGMPAPCFLCGAQALLPATGAPEPGHVFDVVGEKPQGEVFVDCVPPWEVLPDPEAYSLHKVRWLIHQRDMSRTQAWMQFCQGTEINEQDLKQTSAASALDVTFGLTAGDTSAYRPSKRDYVTVKEYFSLPTQKWNDGLHVVSIGEDIISAGRLPYAHGNLPYVAFRGHSQPGELYPRSTVDKLLPIAVAIDDHFSHIHARAMQSVVLKVLAERRHAFRLSNEPGVTEYDHKPGVPEPKIFDQGSHGQDVVTVLERLFAQADEVSFAAEILRGTSPPNVESANHAAFLEERATNPLKSMLEDHADSYQSIGRLLIETVKLFYGDGRTIQLFGQMGHAEFREYKREQVGASHDVILTVSRDIGRSLSSRRAELYEAKKVGVLDDPRLMKLAEFSVDGDMRYERKAHESAALMENERARQGMEIGTPRRHELHDVHLEAHGMLLTELRMTLGPDAPQCQQVEAHMDATEQIVAQEQVRTQMLQQQAAQSFGLANAAAPGQQPAQTAASAVPPPQGQAALLPQEQSEVALEPQPLGQQIELEQANQATS